MLTRLEVECVRDPGPGELYTLRWTEPQARAFMLLHELGHRHDRMTTRGPTTPRGEP